MSLRPGAAMRENGGARARGRRYVLSPDLLLDDGEEGVVEPGEGGDLESVPRVVQTGLVVQLGHRPDHCRTKRHCADGVSRTKTRQLLRERERV